MIQLPFPYQNHYYIHHHKNMICDFLLSKMCLNDLVLHPMNLLQFKSY